MLATVPPAVLKAASQEYLRRVDKTVSRVLPEDFHYDPEQPKPKALPSGKAAHKSAPPPHWADDFKTAVPDNSSSSYSYTYTSYSSDSDSDDNPAPAGDKTSSAKSTPIMAFAKLESDIDWDSDNPVEPHMAPPTTSHDTPTPLLP